ncbi:hypothetical protein FRC18_007200 [Serendipita sp. 400]|nr:hypothetical protein FRC18_007200 [Serendipita sp. 400]
MDRVVPPRPAITPFPSKRHSRFVNVPAPIYAPRINGPRAFNGPLSATTSDEESEDELLPVVGYNATGERIGLQEKEKEKEEEEEEEKTQEAAGVVVPEMDQMKKVESGGVDQNPQGTGPLDIPVDWDDLHERWTSPVMIVHDENALAELLLSSMSMPSSSSSSSPSSSSSSSDEGEEQKGLPVDVASVIVDEDSDAEVDVEERQREDGEALMAFQADVNDLFARSPSLEVEGGEEEEEEEGVMGDERGFGSDDEEEKDEWDQDVIVRFPAPPRSAASPSFVPAGAPSPYSPYPLSMLLRESTLAPPSLHHHHHHHSSSSTSLPLRSISPVEAEKDEVVLPVPLPLLNESGEKNAGSGSDSGRAKRHGRVMVTKPVKLSLDIDIAQAVDRALALAEEGEDESSEEEEELWPAVKKQTTTTTTTTTSNTTTTSAAAAAAAAAAVVPVPRVTLSPLVLPGQNRNKRSSELRIHRGCFKAGESFLMMGSPLSPESASTAGMRTSLCW